MRNIAMVVLVIPMVVLVILMAIGNIPIGACHSWANRKYFSGRFSHSYGNRKYSRGSFGHLRATGNIP